MKWLWSTSGFVVVSLLSVGARAYHEDEFPQNVETTAYSLRGGEHKIGLFAMHYGVTDRVELGLSPSTWGLLFPNLFLGWRFLHWGPVDLKISMFGLYASTRLLRLAVNVPVADVGVFPTQLAASFTITDDLRLSLAAVVTGIVIDGVLDEDLIAGGAATTNMQLRPTLGWRVSRRVMFEASGTYQTFQTTKARVAARLFPDDFTEITAEALAESDILEFPHAYNVEVTSHLSFETFNLRLGVGYGNYTLPIINFVLPSRGFVPRIDFYSRF